MDRTRRRPKSSCERCLPTAPRQIPSGAQSWASSPRQTLLRGGDIQLFGVVLHHATGTEAWGDTANRLAYDAQPPARYPVCVAAVVERNHFVLQNLKERFPIRGILHSGVSIEFAAANGPSVRTVVAFCPPAVEHAQVRHAVQGRFLAAR